MTMFNRPRHLRTGWAAWVVCGAATLQAAHAAPVSPSLSGLWDATLEVGSNSVPFQFGIKVDRDQARGWFFNGEQKVISDTGHFADGHLQLSFSSYAKELVLDVAADGSLNGAYQPINAGANAKPLTVHAERAKALAAASSSHPPAIAGLWIIPAQSRKAGEKAWRLIVNQHGAQLSAAILRVDGDTGALTGRWQDGKWALSHFDGARPALIDVTPNADGSLQVLQHGLNGPDATWTAVRVNVAATQGVPAPADPLDHTHVKDPGQRFAFSFPDLGGKVVSDSDARFHNKVLIVDIAGSWCPNCHDEAPFLETLYRQYRHRGLEVVTLSFEEPEQLADPVRLRAFVKGFGLQYPVLLAGTPAQLHDKVPQALDLDAYPTTFFIGRDGRVRRVHAGFAAPATGEFNVQLKREFARTIEQLLAEKPAA